MTTPPSPRQRAFRSSIVVWGLVVTAACGASPSIGSDCPNGFCDPGASPTIVATDASVEAGSPEVTALKVCPSTECRAPWSTCATSSFECDINLQADPQNCGKCGNSCTAEEVPLLLHGEGMCVAGTCAFACWPPDMFLSVVDYQDCDGIVDNGCEVNVYFSNAHCGQCGHPCDPGIPCLLGVCGCPRGFTLCDGVCIDTQKDVDNCGVCGKKCTGDEVHGPGPVPPNMHLGCADSKCQNVCDKEYPLFPEVFWQDCDGDYATGCEVSVTPYPPDNATAHDNCGACGNACGVGVDCVDFGGHIQCGPCPDGLTLCSTGSSPACGEIDVQSDPNNCGACGIQCVDHPHMPINCIDGVCASECAPRFGDCNGDRTDGCETNVYSDPYNCGVCGLVCDVNAGQLCQAGVCAVQECPKTPDGTPR